MSTAIILNTLNRTELTPARYTVTDGDVREFASTLAEARKTRTWMARGIGLPPGELWIEDTATGRIVIGRWET